MDQPARIPPLSLILGFGPAALLPLLAIAAWALPPWSGVLAVELGRLWGAALLMFLGGVRRGLSFFTDGGPRPAQVATAIWLFVAGLAALLLPAVAAFPLLIVGFLSVALLDPAAARRGEAPDHFARLRPSQMAVAIVGLGGLSARILAG